MNMECHRKLIVRLEAIQHMERDLKGERTAISDYQDHREYLEGLLGKSKFDDKIRSAMNKLSEIESEEKHHGNELTELLNTEFFNTLKAVEDFADCECGRNITQEARQQARVSKPSYKK